VKTKPRFTLLFLVVVFSAQALHAESRFSITGGKASTTVPFELIDNRVFVEARLNGQGPFHLILDTGAAGFSIADAAAQKLRLKVKDAGTGQGVGEKEVRAGQAHIESVQIGDLRFENVETEVLAGYDAINVFGRKPVDGVVGLAVFEQVVAKHDYIRKTMTFTLPDRFSYRGAGVVVPFERPRQIPVVEAELDGVHGKFGIDTGARSSLLLYGPFTEQNHLREKYDARLEGVTGWGIGGPVRSLLARAKELKIGDVVVHDLVIRLSTQKAGATTSSAMAGLIGPDVLAQFDLTVDYPHSRIIFEKNQQYGQRDSYDRAGLWMGQDGQNFSVIDVIPGGPAAEAGIRQGDTILAIDGVPTSKLVLPDVRQQIRREAVGKRIALSLESNGKPRIAVIVLRDLV
jgi:hypothetical protein